MVNWWLILVAVIVALGIMALSVYLVLLYIAEEDAEGGYAAKGIVVLSFSLACIAVLLLPFDVATRVNPASSARFDISQIDTEVMWEVILWMVAIMAVVVVPFTTFYYEAFDPDDEKPLHQVLPAAGYTFIFVLVVGGLTVILWYTVGEANIPYYSYQVPLQLALYIDDSALTYIEAKTSETLNIKVSVFVYMVAVMCFVAWILFFVYGGIGLVALPIDIISDFINRPKAITAAEFARETETVAAKAQVLLQAAQTLDKGKARGNLSGSTKRKVNVLRNEVYLLEEHLDRVIYAYEQAGGSPFLLFGKVAGGFIGAGISVLWVIHIFVYNTLDIHPFLNDMLIVLNDTFSLLAVLAYAIFAFYLLLCTFKGQVKFGMRVVFFKIHPMKVGDTMLNALLFNAAITLIASVAVIQFCGQSFSEFASDTAINALLNVYVRRLKGIGTAISYLKFFFVGVAFLSIFWVIICPRKKKKKTLYKPMSQ